MVLALSIDATSKNWAAQAACRDADPEIFFPPPGRAASVSRETEKALAYCKTCPVRKNCLEDALRVEAMAATVFRAGIFGGTTARERSMIARARRARAPDIDSAQPAGTRGRDTHAA